ncbi:MAG: nitrogen fixation protein NifZ [Nitrospinae bacterium]|nr:nitrogen fixation protein NifZ [Nitrospinota bacterium]
MKCRMEDAEMSRFQQGSKVRALYDVVNDGTVYGAQRGELIKEAGAVGYVKQFGELISGVVYDVHFLDDDRLIGFREHELISGELSWSPAQHQKGSSVFAIMELASKTGNVPKDTLGTVVGVRYHESHGYVYEVRFHGFEDQRYVVTNQQIKKVMSDG